MYREFMVEMWSTIFLQDSKVTETTVDGLIEFEQKLMKVLAVQ